MKLNEILRKLLLENDNRYPYLYHGTSLEIAKDIINSGTDGNTYWASNKSDVEQYANSYSNPAIIRIKTFNIEDRIQPNYTLIDYYKEEYWNNSDYYDELAEEDPDETHPHILWKKSDKTWQDSLDIFGSVILNGYIDGKVLNNMLSEQVNINNASGIGAVSKNQVHENCIHLIQEDLSIEDETFFFKTPYIEGNIRIVNGKDVEILDWNSKYIKRGGTEQVLQDLRTKYGGKIYAIDVGYEHEESFQYWVHMLDKGLIDGFYDDHVTYYSKEDFLPEKK